MNRAERKRLAKFGDVNGLKPTMTANDLITIYSLSWAMALDSEEVDKELVIKLMDKVQENAQCMLSGHIDKRDVEIMVSEAYGIDFVEGVKTNIYVRPDGSLMKG